jgi:hypothetical protein
MKPIIFIIIFLKNILFKRKGVFQKFGIDMLTKSNAPVIYTS